MARIRSANGQHPEHVFRNVGNPVGGPDAQYLPDMLHWKGEFLFPIWNETIFWIRTLGVSRFGRRDAICSFRTRRYFGCGSRCA